MKTVIVGIGGIGGVVGGKLAQSDKGGTNFLCRGKTLNKILSGGLELRSNGEAKIISPNIATDDPSKIGTADAVIFAVKNYSLEQAARAALPMVGKGTVVIPLQNGLDAERKLKSIFRDSDVLGGCIYVSAFVVSPGVVQQNGSVLRVLFGAPALPEDENIRRYAGVRDVFRAAGIDTVLTSDIEREMWMKFIMISSLGTATSLYMKSVGELLSGTEGAETFSGLTREIISLAAAKGIKVPDGAEEDTLKKARSFVPETRTSMELDFGRKGETELDALTGYVCAEAARLGVKVPLYDRAFDKLKLRAASPA